jgi:hypothetical protein
MSFKEIISKIGEKNRERKEYIRKLDEQIRAEEIVTERKKSANQRELEGYMKELQEKEIKVQLEKMRKIRDDEINFGHNPLNEKNITNHVDWEVLKEKNMFKGKGRIMNQETCVLNSNKKLLNNSKWLLK